MSDKQLPTPEAAEAHLTERVHIAAFLDKLASIRPQYMPQNQQQLSELLELGATLQAADSSQKQASASPFGVALAGLKNVLNGSNDPSVKQAAAQNERNRLLEIGAYLASDPDIYASAVSLKLAQAKAAA